MIFDIIGTGPGSPDYLLPIAARHIRDARVLVGAPRLLETFAEDGQERFVYQSNLPDVLGFVDVERNKQKVAVLVSGDPGFHSLLGVFARRFSKDEYRVIPGVSSFQIAAAGTGRPWQKDLLISCHGREPVDFTVDAAEALFSGRRVIFLTDPVRHPGALAKELIKVCGKESGSRRVWIGKDLTMAEEAFKEDSLEALASGHGDWESGLCVLIVK